MSQAPLRFVHAGDLHLERPLTGVSEIPAHLREAFLEAPYLAAEQIFETALTEGADALLLSGDVVHLDKAGPRAIVFLLEQFRRLADHNIAVYWAGGQIDPVDAWPVTATLPPNVHRFPSGRVGNFEHQRNDKTIARVQGISRSPGQAVDDSGFHRDAKGLFTIGVAHGTAAAPGSEGDRVHYMALGGQHRRQTVDQSPGMAHYAGTPQGRTPEETGAFGCTVVSVDESGHVKTNFVAVDVVRFITETIELTAGADVATLMPQFDVRVNNLKSKHPDRDLLVTWQITGAGELLNELRPGGLSDEIISQLRHLYGQKSPAVWSVAIECDEPLCVPEEWYDEETIRGDVLRQLRELEESDDVSLDLEEFFPATLKGSPLAELAKVSKADRAGLLVAASKLSMDLMSLDEDEQ
ncbi:MAG: DNA repair exonuclease [Planctomycetaceae bacterium]|nr:DNA repair exonuclease [Planctomycetaceae bacterium]